MLSIFGDVLLGEPEIDDEYFVAVLVGANEKVFRFDIAVYKLPGVYELQPGDDLQAYIDDGSEGEFSIAALEEIFEGRAQEIHNHDIVVLIFAEVEESRDA